ncbi:MAG: FAD-dependent oxidoreductase [Desulfobacterales bacterium]|nr:FAD-dependent oxidoreductase [Desulfobacterales bacterium]
MDKKRLLVVGGVAGGASCAARARRLSENAEIIIFERGNFVSFANCGLPYHIGNVIKNEDDLLVASPDLFKNWFNIDVRINSNVKAIDRQNKEIEVEDLIKGGTYKEKYDYLVIAPGSSPIRPKLDGIDSEGIFTLRNIPDTRKIISWVNEKKPSRAVIIGAGFIGLEMAENLAKLGISVSIVEMQDQVMPLLDKEMAWFIYEHLIKNKIGVYLGDSVSGFKKKSDGSIDVLVQSGQSLSADIVILAIGVRQEIELAKNAGLEIGHLGGIKVNEKMQTSDKNIWAVGDAVEVKDFITEIQTVVPLAGPANRQGRIAADFIFGKNPMGAAFRGVQGTAVCGIFGLTVASCGLTEKSLQKLAKNGKEIPYEKIYLHPNSHASYYPGAKTISIKLIFSPDDGKILGIQAIGLNAVEKRIDVVSMAIQKQGTVFDLEEAELCYAPQYGSAKDPVNMMGMIASNIVQGYTKVTHWEKLSTSDALILDVREPFEYKRGHVDNAINIPLGQLRTRLNELPKYREIWAYCFVGQRSYYAQRILTQAGFNSKSISGGYIMYLASDSI